jgi:hypothetical protein
MKTTSNNEIQCADGVIDCLETPAAQSFSLMPTPTKIDLRDSHAIRRELGAVYRDMRSGRIETQEGTRLAYVLDMIRKAYETAILQDRIESMERTLRHKP